MAFEGFTEEHFRVFDLAGFIERMAGIRSIVRPALVALGGELAPELSALAGHPLYPHVALHARRKVNPPDDTWVAFGRVERGYKAYAHLAVGICADGLYFGLVLKDESTDKPALGSALRDTSDSEIAIWRGLSGYRVPEWKDGDASTATPEALVSFGDALIQRKTSTFHLLYDIPRTDSRLSDPSAATHLMKSLVTPVLPVYRWCLAERRCSTG